MYDRLPTRTDRFLTAAMWAAIALSFVVPLGGLALMYFGIW